VTFIKWSVTQPVLVLGTNNGNLVFYNKKHQKKKNTALKHSDTVIGGDWNKEGYLVTISNDKSLTVSSHNGDTFYSVIKKKYTKLDIKI
jgi:WD repeat-containing protein 19